MRYIKTAIVLFGLAAFASAAQAQEAEKPTMFTYATYFYCDVTGQDRVDEIVKKENAPVYDQMVKEGLISGWGWLAHHTGGKWRRIQYYQAPTVSALLDAQDEMDKRFKAAGGDDMEFGKICNAHDDYIWEVESGTTGKDRGKAGFSVYYTCNEAKEERADEIFAKDFGPILDKYVAAGKLNSWGWSSHWVGGKFRRLQTMTGADFKSLLAARAELIDEMYSEDNKAGEEFNAICGSHSDYMWEIQLETR
ncbi:hypothetical protein ACFL33_05275 [Pseudomonadota bacterium]|jgi:hypothetical protein